MLMDEISQTERRRHPRTQVQMALRCIRLDPDGGDVVDCLRMMDISRGGMGASCDRAYYPGQRIVLSLPLPADGGRRSIYATIIRCRPSQENYHVGFEFDVIIAVILGGTSLAGGKGSIIGMIVGALIVQVIGNGLNMLNVLSFWQSVIKGFLLVLAVVLNQALVRTKGR